MKTRHIAFALAVAAAVKAFSVSGGEAWRGWDEKFRLPEPRKIHWQADFSRGEDAFRIERCGGAEGDVVFSPGAVTIRKTNGKGYLAVWAKEPIEVPPNTDLRSFADSEVKSADQFHSVAFPRLVGRRRQLTASWGHDAIGVHMLGGPKMGHLVCTPPGVCERRYAGWKTSEKDGTGIYPVLVVGGAPSLSVWRRWGVEDNVAAAEEWRRELSKPNGVAGRKSEAVTEESFAKRLESDFEHTAKVVKLGSAPRLVVDGRAEAPVFYKMNHGWGEKSFRTTGTFLCEKGVKLQVVAVRGAAFWDSPVPDVAKAVAATRGQMRLSPDALAIVSLSFNPPEAYSEANPSEIFRHGDGSAGYGDYGKMRVSPDGKRPRGCWPWVSPFSKVWQRDVGKFLAGYVGELKRTGLSKRIVGFHLFGFHDGQFAPYRLDHSVWAMEGFREWREKRGRPLDRTSRMPRFPAVKEYFASSGRDGLDRDFQIFQHEEMFRIQERFARTVKAAFGKDVVSMHWSMDVMSGGGNGAYYMDEFVRSDAMDILVSQPPYAQRSCAVAFAEKIPVASFAKHGKLYVDEFDLRTYAGIGGYVRKDVGAFGLSRARNFTEWQSIHRRLVGYSVVRDQGWWYFDIDGGFFEPEEIAGDIGKTLGEVRDLLCKPKPKAGWEPSAAMILDEKGLLSRNISSGARYDERRAVEHQSFLLAASGVPYDVWLASDAVAEPSLVGKRRILVVAGFYELTSERVKFVKDRLAEGKTVVLLAGAGAAGGAGKLGFKPVFRPAQSDHELESLTGREADFRSVFHADNLRWSLGVDSGPIAAQWRPASFSFDAGDGWEALARYAKGGGTAAIAKRIDGGRLVVLGSSCALTPEFFGALAAEAGAYAPVKPGIVQVDMNGEFVSLHALKSGGFSFELPFPCEATNLKTGRKAPRRGRELKLDLAAGSTMWLRLEPR
jgi:hypothetical protein